MSQYREFTGKTIDEAIEQACEHFDTEREKLEIEILSDAKGGIFGLVGTRKAEIRARMRDNSPELKALITTVVDRVVSPIVQHPDIDVDVEEGSRAKVTIQDDANSGLLIGREGQTLAAVQYLVNRIVANKWPEPVKVQVDTGDYRERQDDNLRQLAQHLAEKVRNQGKPQSTRPLSSYHRRVVHLALQEDETVTTRSKGDGPLKRVLILPRRGDKRARTDDSTRQQQAEAQAGE